MVGVHHSYLQSVLNFMAHFCLSLSNSEKSYFSKMLFFQQAVGASGHSMLSVMGLGVLLCYEP